ncbi:MAG: chemotaxis protein CheW [Chloroflexi bacterium]|nr:chemotaxis protein CheW [Chloroflexota bacterium]
MATDTRSSELEEIWSLFAQEGAENLTLAEETLLTLEQDLEDTEQIKILFRALHSFKGGARMMGMAVVESLAHHAEDLVALVRDDGVSLQLDMINLLLTVVDRLRSMLDHIVSTRQDVHPDQAEGLIADLQKMVAQDFAAEKNRPEQNEIVAVPVATEPIAAAVEASVEKIAAADDSNSGLPDAPNNLADFLKQTEANLSQLHSALEAFANGASDALTQIHRIANELKTAAERLNYHRLVAVLDALETETQSNPRANMTGTEDRLLRLKKVELEIFEELTHIQDQANLPQVPEQSDWTDIAWLFRRWNAERVYADLARLSEIANVLDQLLQRFTVESSISRESEKLADEATVHLKAIYHTCIFYHLDQAMYVSLALEDLYGRSAQGELTVNEALTRLTRAYVTNLGGAIDAIREGETPDLGEFPKLIEQVQNFMYLHIDGPVFQVSRNVLDVLKLPDEFKQAMTPETMAKFSQALQAGEHFYTVLADLERDEALGAAFLEWAHSDGIRLMTNISVYRSNRILFNFLLATSLSREDLLASLVKMDAELQYLTLEECTVRENLELEQKQSDQSGQSTPIAMEATNHARADISNSVIEEIGDALGALLADHATLRRIAQRLADQDLIDLTLRIAQNANGDWALARHELAHTMSAWTEDIASLNRIENQVSVTLDRLQEATRSLRLVLAAELLDPLRRMVHEVAQRQGKLIDLDLQGGELELDRGAIETLSEVVHRLVWFAVTQGIENVERRRTANKPTAGRVLVKVIKHEDHAQVVIEDDGCGLNREMILQRARELGWVNDGDTHADELDYVLRPGFGLIGNENGAEGIDLAVLYATLRARHGRLTVSSVPGQKTRFIIQLPLDMAVLDGMIVRAGEVRYIVPVNSIRRIVKADAANLVTTSADGCHTLLRSEGELVPVHALSGSVSTNDTQHLMMVVDGEQGQTALLIDELLGRQQVLVHPLQGQLANVQDASGCVLLGEGEVGLVLNMRF